MDNVITIKQLNKVYNLYDKPIDRMKEALSIRKKTYHKEHYSLKNVSLEVGKGETIGIIGSNGAGKSTLLKIITGVLTPTSGNICVKGKISALLELGAGFNSEYTGLENIYLNGIMMGYSEEQMREKVKSIIDFADIGEFVNQPVKTYSSGMFARLAFAVAINVEPDILIVDETLSVGDVRFQIKCMNKMHEMMKDGTTVLFVSHDMNAIRRFCSKVYWLHKGELISTGDTNQVVDNYLDFLKNGELTNEHIEPIENDIQEFTPNDNIAEVISFNIYNNMNQIVKEFKLDEMIKVEIIYDVYDTNINNPVLGVAIRGLDDDYVCGLNTLLDNIHIPWKYGRNRMVLEYPHGILAVSGKYYFDVAIYEETATVPIQYITMIKEFSLLASYEGEGRYIIPHQWRRMNE